MTKQKNTSPAFHPIPKTTWGFQPLEPLSELRDKKGQKLGTLFKTYLNDPVDIPGRAIWVFAKTEEGGWAATSEISETDLQTQVLKLFRH